MSSCFKLHGYLEWWADRNRSGKASSFGRQPPAIGMHSSTSGGKAHAVTDVPQPKAGTSDACGNDFALKDLNSQQVQALLNMININSKTHRSRDW